MDSYSPVPDYAGIDFPTKYRDYLVNEMLYLQAHVPTTAAELNGWLWTCADCLAHIVKGPKSIEQIVYAAGVFSDALSQSTGRPASECTELIVYRTKLALQRTAA